MTTIDKQGAAIMSRLISLLAKELEDQPDHLLLDWCQDIYEAVFDGCAFLTQSGIEAPLAGLHLLARFHHAAGHGSYEIDKH